METEMGGTCFITATLKQCALFWSCLFLLETEELQSFCYECTVKSHYYDDNIQSNHRVQHGQQLGGLGVVVRSW